MAPSGPSVAMEYQVVVEYDPATRHYTATVAGIPAIVVDARSERSAVRRAREAISLYLEEGGKVPRGRQAKPVRAKLVPVRV